jgi:hypothetical protein
MAGACCPAFSLEPWAFDSSIGRVNYLTGVSVDTRMWDHSYFHRRMDPALRRNPGTVGALSEAPSIAAHIVSRN